MGTQFESVALGEVLVQDKNYVTELETKIYPKLSVKLYGKGVTLDNPTDGGTVRMQRHQFAKPGQVILSEIWAKKGAIGIVPPEGKGALVTSHFFLFDVNETKIFPEYINWLLKGNFFADTLDTQARGTTGYAAIRPKQFLALEIPLPPLDEQHRIVRRIEALARRVSEAQRLRREAVEEAETLLRASLSQITKRLLATHPPKYLEDLTLLIGDMNHEMPEGQEDGIPFISPKDFMGNGQIDFANSKKVTSEDFYRLSKKCCPQKGDILMARYGTIGVARYIDTEREFLASYSIAVIRPNPTFVEGKFLYWMTVSPYVQEQAIKGIRGSGMADLGLKTIRQFVIPQLDFNEQRYIVEYLDNLQAHVNALNCLQAETQKKLDALLPSILDRAFKGEL